MRTHWEKKRWLQVRKKEAKNVSPLASCSALRLPTPGPSAAASRRIVLALAVALLYTARRPRRGAWG